MDFRRNLKENRKRARLSQEELADKISVSRQTISKWESGDSYPSTQHILMIAKYLDCSMDDHISPKGWNKWEKSNRDKTAKFYE